MGVAGAVVAAGVVGAVGANIAAGTAADAQTNASNKAISAQEAELEQTRQELQPFRDAGAGAVNQLATLTGSGPGGDPLTAPLTKPITMDQATLEATPGYQFNLSQGLKSVQNSAAARGLGVSGAALKGAATYATGLADSTYQNQFNNAVTNQTNTFNRLSSLAGIGESAAAQTGVANTQTGTSIGSDLVGIGNAQGAAALAGGAGISNAAGSISNAALLNKLLITNSSPNSGGLYGAGSNGPANSAESTGG